MPKIFDRVGSRKPRYSAFDLSREQKLSFSMGELVPTYLDEIVPGDQFRVRSEAMLRLSPLLAPVMHRVNLYMHYFFVPNRIVWNQWEEYITGGKDGESVPNIPIFTMGTVPAESRLADYMGIPAHSSGGGGVQIQNLPFRAYQQIWYDYYRDENFDPEVPVQSMDNPTLSTLRTRNWEKDYYTSCLPWTQRGPEVTVPAGFNYRDPALLYKQGTDDPTAVGALDAIQPGGGIAVMRDNDNDATRIENISGDEANLNINDLRKSSALQRFLEKQARGGYRYIETILSHFGVKSSDARLQRAEYLGGGRQPIVISEVLNTTGTTESPQGDMAGHGISVGTTNSFSKRFEEHGYVLGIMSVLPRTGYQQGIERHWLRSDKEDFYWPEFANLGEQEVTHKEVFFDEVDDGTYNNGTFGYQQRYAEYKYGCSTVHGDFRNTLDYWHMGRIFDTPPALNADFVNADPTTRIFAVEEGDQLWCQLYHSVKARRPMPYFADPRLT